LRGAGHRVQIRAARRLRDDLALYPLAAISRAMLVALDFRVWEDVAAVHGERLAPGQCVELAFAIEHPLIHNHEPPREPIYTSAAGQVPLMDLFGLGTTPCRT